jgi:Domain of unknown function (DUF4386)
MTVEDKTSRLAGFLYLVVVVTGLFSLAYVPSQIPLSGDPRAAVNNIMASESLFRLGIAGFMIMQVAFLLLPLVLFRLLRPVGEAMATCMVALAVVSVAIGLVSSSSRLDALSLLTDARYAAMFTPQQLQAEVMLAVGEYRSGIFITKLFWGLWLLPFGYLVFRSGFLPKILGILLMLGCVGYVVEVFGELLVPGYAESLVSRFAGNKPAAVGEIGTCLWLLVIGARRPRSTAVHQVAAADAAASRQRG